MRIEVPKEALRLGAVRIHSAQKVYQLDSGLAEEQDPIGRVIGISNEVLEEIEQEMAIIVPVRDENLNLLEGVLAGIPAPCLVIVVSNSQREPLDHFALEVESIERFSRFTRKEVLVVHQKDRAFGRAFLTASYPGLVQDGVVRSGKAEGMILGTALAHLIGRRYLGFIDADNYFPGAVHEYVRGYAAGFALSDSPFTMVRISWQSKPKVVRSRLYFAKWGRTSAVTNQFLNRPIRHCGGCKRTDVIETGNAGEHALTLDLALRIGHSHGYSIEPYHFICLLEKYSGGAESRSDLAGDDVRIYQIKSRNPHLHDSGDEEHVNAMIAGALQVIYHSSLTPDSLREAILKALHQKGEVLSGEIPARCGYYPELSEIDWEAFRNEVADGELAGLFDSNRQPLLALQE